MNQLVRYLLENLIIDFQGDLDVDMVRTFLSQDPSPSAKNLLARITADRGTSDMLIALADCLKDSVRTGIDEAVVEEQLELYVES